MHPEADNMVEQALKELSQPMGINSLAVKKALDKIAFTSRQCFQSVQDDVNAYLLNVGNDAEYVKTSEQLNARLEELHQVKLENDHNKTKKTEQMKRVRAEEDEMKKQLKITKREGEEKLKSATSRLDKGRTAFSAYLTVCGHVRLGTTPETSGELRGTVSAQPSDVTTFSLDPAALPPVRLADRLWRLAAEGPTDAPGLGGEGEKAEKVDGEVAQEGEDEKAEADQGVGGAENEEEGATAAARES